MGSLDSRRQIRADATPRAVWAVLEHVDRYPSWWPWLRGFDGRRLAAGERWWCRVRSPLPWSLRLVIDLSRVEAPSQVEAVVSGDVEGSALLTIAAGDGGSLIQLDSSLVARRGPTRLLHRVAPVLSRRAHDHVVDAALEQLADRVRRG